MLGQPFDFMEFAKITAKNKGLTLPQAIRDCANRYPDEHKQWLAAQREQTPTARRYAAIAQKGGGK